MQLKARINEKISFMDFYEYSIQIYVKLFLLSNPTLTW